MRKGKLGLLTSISEILSFMLLLFMITQYALSADSQTQYIGGYAYTVMFWLGFAVYGLFAVLKRFPPADKLSRNYNGEKRRGAGEAYAADAVYINASVYVHSRGYFHRAEAGGSGDKDDSPGHRRRSVLPGHYCRFADIFCRSEKAKIAQTLYLTLNFLSKGIVW